MQTFARLSPRSLGLLFLVAGACKRAAAEEYPPGSIRVIPGLHDEGPWHVPKSDFEALISKPNATGTFGFPGTSLSSPPGPGGGAAEGWSWTISVRADMPMANTTDKSYLKDFGDKFYTGGKLTFNAPKELLGTNLTYNTTVRTLGGCLFEWDVTRTPYNDKLRGDDGSCSSVLSSECIADMQRKAVEETSSSSCRCPSINAVTSCAGDATQTWETSCVGSPFNSAEIQQNWTDGKYEMTSWGTFDPSDRGNLTSYNAAGSVAWPVMVAFWGVSGPTVDLAKMACVRAKDVAEGSTAPVGPAGGNKGSSGSRAGANLFALWTLGVLSAAWMAVF